MQTNKNIIDSYFFILHKNSHQILSTNNAIYHQNISSHLLDKLQTLPRHLRQAPHIDPLRQYALASIVRVESHGQVVITTRGAAETLKLYILF